MYANPKTCQHTSSSPGVGILIKPIHQTQNLEPTKQPSIRVNLVISIALRDDSSPFSYIRERKRDCI